MAKPQKETRRVILGGIGSSAAVLLVACSLLLPHWTYRYRLTVQVEQDGRVHTGSSVIEVRREQGVNAIGARVFGEAVIVDLGNGDLVFALLRGRDSSEAWSYSVAHKAFVKQLGTKDITNNNALTRLTQMVGATAVLSSDQHPMLVRFRDIHDPRTVERIDPDAGPSATKAPYRVRSVSIQITHDPVTRGISKKLTWLINYPERSLSRSHSPNDFSISAILRHGDFRRTNDHES